MEDNTVPAPAGDVKSLVQHEKSTRAAWRLRDYLDLGVIGATHGLSDGFAGMLKPILALIVVDLGLSTVQAGMLLSAFSISTFLFLYPISLLADDSGKKKQILIAGMALAALAFLGMQWATSFSAVALLAFLAGAGNATFHPCGTALTAERFPQHRTFAVSFFSMMGNGGASIIPVVLAFVAVRAGWRVGVTVCALPALVLLPAVQWRFRNRSQDTAGTIQRRFWQRVRDISRQGLRNRSVVLLAGVYALSGMGTGLFSGFLSLLASERFGLGTATVGLMLSAYLLAGVFAKPLMGLLYDAWGARTALVIPLSLAGLFITLIAVTSWPGLLFPLIVVTGIVVPISPIILTAAAERSNPDALASAVGLIYTSHGLGFISPLIGGLLAQWHGLGASYLFAAVLVWAAGGVALLLGASERRGQKGNS